MSNQKRLSSEEFVPLINYHKERETEVLADWADFALSCSRWVAGASPVQKTGQHIKKNAALFDPFDLSVRQK